MEPYALCVHHLHYQRGQRQILSDINLKLSPGQGLQLVGANGCGKTTLLALIAGLLPEESGAIQWQGCDIHSQFKHYCQQMLYLGHKTGLKPWLTVCETMQHYCAVRSQKSRVSVQQVLQQLQLDTLVNHLVGELSAGQQRRLAWAPFLMFPASLWLLDEPFVHLDVPSSKLCLQLIQEHLINQGMVVIASHQGLALEYPHWEMYDLSKDLVDAI